jgi:hypothetical protein
MEARILEKSIPENPRRDHVKRMGREFILKNNIRSFPVDIDTLYKNNGIFLQSVTQAENTTGMLIPSDFYFNDKTEAITVLYNYSFILLFI